MRYDEPEGQGDGATGCSLVVLVVMAASLAAAAPPAIVVDDDAKATSNRSELLAVSSALNLPSGKIAVDVAPVFSKLNAGLFLAGNQTTMANVIGGNWVTGRAMGIRPGGVDGIAVLSFFEPKPLLPLPANQVGWFFDAAGSDGIGFFPAPTIRVTSGQPIPQTKLPHFMRAHHAVPFGGQGAGVRAFMVPKNHGFRVGDDVFATDGPLINEVVPEFRKITALGGFGDVILLDSALTRTYRQGAFVAGPIPKKLSFQGLTFRGQWGPILVQQAVDVSFNDCTFDQAEGWSSVIGSARVSFLNCTMPSGFQSSASHNVTLKNCTIREVVGEQCAYDFTFDGCRIGPGSFDSKVRCTGWIVRYCVTTGGFFVYDNWAVHDHVAYGPVTVRGHGAVVSRLWSAQPVHVQAVYQGGPEKAATGVMLDGIVAPSIHLWPGTSGVIQRTTCPVTGDKANWVIR